MLRATRCVYASLDAFARPGHDGGVSEVGAAGSSAEESVVLAAFENRNAAERMLRSLGREFRQKAQPARASEDPRVAGTRLLW